MEQKKTLWFCLHAYKSCGRVTYDLITYYMEGLCYKNSMEYLANKYTTNISDPALPYILTWHFVLSVSLHSLKTQISLIPQLWGVRVDVHYHSIEGLSNHKQRSLKYLMKFQTDDLQYPWRSRCSQNTNVTLRYGVEIKQKSSKNAFQYIHQLQRRGQIVGKCGELPLLKI